MAASQDPLPLARSMSRLAERFAESLRVSAQMRRHGFWTDPPPAVLDAGTGRMMVVPVVLWLLGCARWVVTVDVRRQLAPQLVALQHAFYRGRRKSLLALPEADPVAVAKRLDRFLALWSAPAAAEATLVERLLALCNVTYVAPCDAGELDMPSDSFDVQVSTHLLEHVSPEGLPRLLRNGHRLLRPGGIAVHLIDHSDHADHLARFRANAPRFGFLRFEDQEWRKQESSYIYMNRMRSSEYMPYFESAGFDILEVGVTVDDEAVDAIQTGETPLASRFRDMVPADVATRQTLLVVRKPFYLVDAS